MEPHIKNGDTVLISGIMYFFKNPRINDIVAFKDASGKILVKRITEKQDNGFFIEGDNKSDSLDSRTFGMISKDKILGKVIYKF